ncbi:3-(3-hydroxy-phenyl)propionate hydroxylase [Rhodococcus rhodochrous J3]|uniref:3-(3-hydroxy-phenyl)propionate hydroxylase n=1 Tax=Rhodococcus rhodochrous J3 TaxID=903528 RepID=A0ABY1MHS1_RHORH|nr:FAD-dependent monooxygenase [Rhodococcus rhodochrous]MBF4477292.1 FAD-dependent monooxygenase [Rhodococcus rhodochrous]TWH52707.1 3-(3-hydroxy-phenyl)propionate hydroxylase [Rhodococcus rhodochrous J38]SMG56461.1 3-(3-hydroxy-phenyl)propionate hydroxylase [Rhodococcus rhodochrous J3]
MSTYYQPPKYPASEFESMTPADETLPVVVVGAGPVGMAVALGLAQRGVPVTILEAADQVSFGSRAICISRHSLEAAARLGFGDELEKIVLPWVGGRSFYRDQQVLHFQMPQRDFDVRPPMINVSQSEFEQIMVDTIEQNPLITLHWQAPIAGILRGEDEVTLEVDTAAGKRHLRARWVVAADGGRSRMRELAGLRLQGTSYEGRYVIADIHWESDLPAERMVWFDPPSNPGSTIIMHKQPGNIWRIDYQLDPSEDAEIETQEEAIRARIAKHLDWLQNDLPWTLEWKGFYSARALALDEFTHDRLLFAGDAAHLVPIFGVRGLNSGMEDAETLAWQLAAVVNGNAEPALLKAYSFERHNAWEQNVANAGKSTLIMSPGSHGYRTTRDAILALAVGRPEFGHLINPRQSSATHARLSPLTWSVAPGTEGVLPGDPVEDRRIRIAGRETSLNDARGTGFAVLGVGLDAAGSAALAAAANGLAQALAPESVAALAVDSAEVDGVTLLDAPDLVEALGATAGEAFVIRPDGLLLCRVPVADLDGVAASLRSGAAPAGAELPARPAEQVTEDDQRRENVWLGLSTALDQAAEDDREGFLTRLALVLGSQVDRRQFEEAIAAAADTSPLRVEELAPQA